MLIPGLDTTFCPGCKEELPHSAFAVDNARKSGLQGHCKPCRRTRGKDGRDLVAYAAYQVQARVKLRAQVLEAFGGACVCCGETTPEFLAVDHINNDGAAHRKRIGGNLYHWLRKNGFPQEGLQLLCHNCNCAKAFYKGCPHVAFNVFAGATA